MIRSWEWLAAIAIMIALTGLAIHADQCPSKRLVWPTLECVDLK